ncbi:MAG: transposase [Herminiimonas sp.]|nr:transposase [Herminiimonas sp.]
MPYTQTESIPSKPKRRHFTAEHKAQIAQEAMVAGASVSRVARNHDVNTNQVFKWIRDFRRGHAGALLPAPKLLPVVLDDIAADTPAESLEAPPPKAQSGTIELHLARGRVCLNGSVDADILRIVLDRLVS